MFDVNFLTI